MTPLVADQISRLVPSGPERHFVVPEVPAGQGIADLVAVRFDQRAVRHRLEHGIGPVCSPNQVRALCLLRGDRFTRLETVSSKIGVSLKTLKRTVFAPLANLSVIELTDTSARLTGAWRPVGARVTAVELKLSKWQSALRQAGQFTRSADRSWVVMDAERGRAARAHLATFAEFGVGLAFLSPDGRLDVACRPCATKPQPWLRTLMTETAWAAAEHEVATVALDEGTPEG